MSKNMEQTNQNQQTQQPQFKCPGNCLQCLPAQRQYCASQHAYSNMKVLDKIMETLLGMKNQMDAMQDTIGELSAKIEAIQNGEAAVFDPNDEGELFPKENVKDAKDK
jgi:hypothetical protein